MSAETSKVDKMYTSEVKIEKFTYQWKITNFSYLCTPPGQNLSSPVFSFGKINWNLVLFPNGNSEETKGYVVCALCWKQNSIVNGQSRFSIINAKKQKMLESHLNLSLKLPNKAGISIPKFITQEKLLNKANGILDDDCLTIQCEIVLPIVSTPAKESKKQMPKVNPVPMTNWLKKLFLEERMSDFKLFTPSGKSLPAHKNILDACSPVFRAMFTHDMQEQSLAAVKIEDEEYQIAKEMLRFIYLGEVENLETIVFELLQYAHRYQIVELINFCAENLMKQISVDNALKLIAKADVYNIECLKTYAVEFGRAHLKDVVNSNDFKSSTYPESMKCILEAIGQQK